MSIRFRLKLRLRKFANKGSVNQGDTLRLHQLINFIKCKNKYRFFKISENLKENRFLGWF